MHFHDLRHTHETWLIEDHVPRIMRLVRLGHKRKDVDDLYSHITDQMVEETWMPYNSGGSRMAGGHGRKPPLWSQKRHDLFGCEVVVRRLCSQSAPKNHPTASRWRSTKHDRLAV